MKLNWKTRTLAEARTKEKPVLLIARLRHSRYVFLKCFVHLEHNRKRISTTTCDTMPLQLYYFPVKGRGQAIRYMLLDNNLEYEEVNTAPMENWVNNFKPKMPFGQVPLLKDGDFEVAQSTAILRYIGRKAGIEPKDIKDLARVDMVNDQVEDIRNAYVRMIYRDYEAGKEGHIKSAIEMTQYLEKLMKSWGNDFILGHMTFADYNLFDLLDIHEVLSPGFLGNFPTLKAYYDRIASRPAILKCRQSEEFKKMNINGNGKQ